MIIIEWIDGDAKGWDDLLDDRILSCTSPFELVHICRRLGGRLHYAKCECVHEEKYIDLNYEKFTKYNEEEGFYIGVLRIELEKGAPKKAGWKPAGENKFSSEEIKVSYAPGITLSDYDINKINNSKIKETMRKQLISARRGQGFFRQRLFDRWEKSCALTGIFADELLRASHIKPWSESSNIERLDRANGLLLAAHVDALFDSHLISFYNGQLCWSDSISDRDREALALPKALRLPLKDRELTYMARHYAVFSERNKR